MAISGPGTRPVSRRGLFGAGTAVLLAGGLTACGTRRPAGTGTGTGAGAGADTGLWHHGRLYIATGNTTGVWYQIGGGYADIITAHLPGYEATAEPTNATVDNLRRLARGDADLAFTFADAAADAVLGRAPFAAPQPAAALARIYNSYTHVIARAATGTHTVADLRGRRVSTGSPGSGSEIVAQRVLTAAGLDPDRDLKRLAMSLPETVKAMRNGTIDAMFWTGGLPAIGISDLIRTAPDRLVFVPAADLLPNLRTKYGDAYTSTTIAREAYGQPGDVATIAVGGMIVVRPDLPDDLAHELARLLFDYQKDLASTHPEGRNFTREAAVRTEPVPLHPGARRYYGLPPARGD